MGTFQKYLKSVILSNVNSNQLYKYKIQFLWFNFYQRILFQIIHWIGLNATSHTTIQFLKSNFFEWNFSECFPNYIWIIKMHRRWCLPLIGVKLNFIKLSFEKEDNQSILLGFVEAKFNFLDVFWKIGFFFILLVFFEAKIIRIFFGFS